MDKYLKKEIKLPFVNELKDDLDLKYFDKMFTEEPIDSNRTTIYSRPKKYSTYIFWINKLNIKYSIKCINDLYFFIQDGII